MHRFGILEFSNIDNYRINSLLKFTLLIFLIKVSFSQSIILPYSETADNILVVIGCALAIVIIGHQTYTIHKVILFGIITVVSLISVWMTKDFGLLISIIVCMMVSDQDINKIITFVYFYESMYLVVHTFLAVLVTCIFSHTGVNYLWGVYETGIRFKFGMDHPNVFSIYAFNLIIMWLWIHYRSIRFENLIIIFALSLILFGLTKTRTSFLMTVITCLMIYVALKHNLIFDKIIIFFSRIGVPLLSCIMYICASKYICNYKIIMFADKLLSARIKLGAYAYTHWGITLFGQNLSQENVVWDAYWQLHGHTFDNVYTYAFMNVGVVWLIGISIAFIFLANLHNVKISLFIIVWALYGITEVHGLNCYLCFPVLLVGLLLDDCKSYGYLLLRGED